MRPTALLAPFGAAGLRPTASMACSREGLTSPGQQRRQRWVEPKLGFHSAGVVGGRERRDREKRKAARGMEADAT
jgi:hypothetical protein